MHFIKPFRFIVIYHGTAMNSPSPSVGYVEALLPGQISFTTRDFRSERCRKETITINKNPTLVGETLGSV